MLGLFAIEQVLVLFCWLDHDFAVLPGPLIVLILAFIVYRTAVVQAGTWGSVVQITFDTHRNDLKKLLGVRDFSGEEDERNVWDQVSRLLLWNNKVDDAFVEPHSPPSPLVTAPANVKVDVHTSILNIAQPQQVILQQLNGNVTGVSRAYADIHYVLLISNTSNTEATNANNAGDTGNVYLFISDPRVARIEKMPTPQDKEQHCVEIVRTNEPGKVDALLWCISGLKGNGSTALSYKLPMYFFKATLKTPGLQMTENLEAEAGKFKHTFVLKNDGPQDILDAIIEVFDNRQPVPAGFQGYWVGSEDPEQIRIIDPKMLPGELYCYRWKIPQVTNKQHVTLRYEM